MTSNNHNLAISISENKNNNEPLPIKMSSMALFDDRSSFFNCSRVFYSYFEQIPSFISFRNIDYKKVLNWMERKYSNEIVNQHYKKYCKNRTEKINKVEVILILRNEILVGIEEDRSVRVYFTLKSEEFAISLGLELKKFVDNSARHSISLIINRGHGLDLIELKNKKPKLDLIINYNDDLNSLHGDIVKSMKKKNNCGLTLFHGVPGTGKSTYIRYLIHCLNKKVIFLPPRLAGNLDSPELINILCENPNSILVIEDAENILTSREANKDSNLSMLLNLTDGLLGESLGIQVVCTFNTKVSNIDKALLRKGRLIALYEFKELSATKTGLLIEKLGMVDCKSKEGMTLADIYNLKEQQFDFSVGHKKQIGFTFDIREEETIIHLNN